MKSLRIQNLVFLWRKHKEIESNRVIQDPRLDSIYKEILEENINRLFPEIEKQYRTVIRACLVHNSDLEYVKAILTYMNPLLTQEDILGENQS